MEPAAEGESAPAAAKPQLEITTSRLFQSWQAEEKVSFAFTTYQAGKLFLVGMQPNGRLSIEERSIPRCMGMTVQGNSLYVSSLFQVFRFENAVPPGQMHDGYDRVYVPKMSWITGDLDIHDMAVDADGRLVFVNTLFSCLATASDRFSFEPLWKPSFISQIGAEDRCHLNGLAMRDGRPAYVTAVSRSDAAGGWRDRRDTGGIVIDVASNEVVLDGLSMPHSPRLYRDKLWVLNSGTGFFGYVDLAAGKFEPVTFCPGYLRGLSFQGDYAIVGLSKQRENRTFSGLALDDALKARDADARCGIAVIDLKTGSLVHMLRIDGVIRELYDVAVVPGAFRPTAIGFLSDQIRRVISLPPSDGWPF
ncbi:MAG: TIGR03032 family protein [Alphaproteobacteria bacterium]